MNATRWEGFHHRATFRVLARWFASTILMAGLVVIGHTSSIAQTNEPTTDDKSGNLLRDHRSDIVLIKGKAGAGSGFVITRGGRRFLVSNAHVMAGIKAPAFTPLDRTPLQFKPAAPSLAVGHDIMLLELEPGTNGIPPVESFESEVAVNDPIVVFGNTGGSDVATAIKGKLLGIGPNRIEIDAEIEHGNSGSPVIHVPSGRVIGVATYATTDDLLSGEKKIRRFGYRLDTVKQWESVDWKRFYAEADKLEQITDVTSELKRAFIELNGLNQRTSKVRVYAYESPMIRNALDSFYVAIDDARTQRDADRTVNNLLGTLNGVSQSYPMTVKPTFTYEYFRRQFTEQEGDRTEIMKSFIKILKK